MGHYWLHDEFYQSVTIETVADWKHAQQLIGEDYHWFEYQANSFAGLVLVPQETLLAQFEATVAAATKKGLLRSDIEDWPARKHVIRGLADRFSVSYDTMRIRLEKDSLLPELRSPEDSY